MGDESLDYFCRLCLKECFSLKNIFSHRSPSGDIVYRILNFIYDLKIQKDDGLPSQICTPCLWRMLEFDTYKRNVHYAEEEIRKLISDLRNDSIEISGNEANNGEDVVYEDIRQVEAAITEDLELENERNAVESVVSIKEEIEIDELEIPKDLKGRDGLLEEYLSGAAMHIDKGNRGFQNESDCSEGVSLQKDTVLKQEEIELIGEEVDEALGHMSGIEINADTDDRNFSNELECLEVMSSRLDKEFRQEECRVINEETQEDLDLVRAVDEELEEESCDEGIFILLLAREYTSEEELHITEEYTNIEKELESDVHNSLNKECFRESEESSVHLCVKKGYSLINTAENLANEDKQQGMSDIRDDELTRKESTGSLELESSERLQESPVLDRESYVCDVCKKCFCGKGDLRQHIWIHYNDRPFGCNKCGQRFKYRYGIRAHELRHLRDEKNSILNIKEIINKPYSCGECGKRYQLKRELYLHSRRHRKKFFCATCEKCFCSNIELERHSRIHSNEKPFSCTVCKKSFNLKSNLKQHMSTHSSSRPFSCSICSNKFKSKREKAKHELIHLRK